MSSSNDQISSVEKRHDDSIIRTLNALLLIAPIFIVVIAINRIIVGDFPDAIVLLLTVVAIPFFRSQLKKTKRYGVVALFLSLLFVIALTFICTIGNGIHDLAIVGFPVVLGFSSIVLKEKELILIFLIILFSITWLVFGEINGFIESREMVKGSNADFLIASTIVILGGVITYMLSRNLRNSLKHSKEEYIARNVAANELEKELAEKNRLIGEVHSKVIKSLSYIRKLSSQNNNSIYRKIMCIEVAHSLLNRIKAYQKINIGDYSELLIQRYREYYQEKLEWETSFINEDVSIDDCISFGICLSEMIHRTRKGNADGSSIDVTMSEKSGQILAEVKSDQLSKYNEGNSSIFLMETMAKQLKGSLETLEEQGIFIQSLRFENRRGA